MLYNTANQERQLKKDYKTKQEHKIYTELCVAFITFKNQNTLLFLRTVKLPTIQFMPPHKQFTGVCVCVCVCVCV